MTIVVGDVGRPTHGVYKQLDITLPTPRERTGLGLILPITEPMTPQVSYTVQESDLARFSFDPISVDHNLHVTISGRTGATTSAANMSHRLLINGVSQIQSLLSSAMDGAYYTYSFHRFAVKVGDVIGVSLWSNQPDCTLDYSAFCTFYSRIQVVRPNTLLRDVTFNNALGFPILQEAPSPNIVSSTQGYTVSPAYSAFVGQVSISGTVMFPALLQDPLTYYLGRCNYGDFYTAVQRPINVTNKCVYYRNFTPTSISYREVLG